ncbi:MAG: hypothetical protein IJ515_03610 [Clostridia bacterium]|nr:hypothetical protein [Clostridia bacterium]
MSVSKNESTGFLDALAEMAYDRDSFVEDIRARAEGQIDFIVKHIYRRIKEIITGNAKNGNYTLIDGGKRQICGGLTLNTLVRSSSLSRGYVTCSHLYVLPQDVQGVISLDTLAEHNKKLANELLVLYNGIAGRWELGFFFVPRVERLVTKIKKTVPKTVYGKGFLFFRKKETVMAEVTEEVSTYRIEVVGYTKKVLDGVKSLLSADGISVSFEWAGVTLDDALTIPEEKITDECKAHCAQLLSDGVYERYKDNLITIRYNVEF